MRLPATLALLLLLATCSSPHQIMDRQDYLAEATRTYEGVQKETVIDAARMVLHRSDPKDWDFRYTADGFVGLRRYFIYAIIAAASGQEKWEFTARHTDSGAIHAAVTVSEAGVASGGYSTNPYEAPMNSIELYRLFWGRVDYVLGRRSDWPTCEQAIRAAKARGEPSAAVAGLCGPTSQGSDAPPPKQITGI